ncbi:MAG: hypothetical protein ACRYE8_01885 [Janthinobacterium lividum]
MDHFPFVIPWLDHGIQLKILKLLVLKVVFLDPMDKPRDDTEVAFRSTQQSLCGDDTESTLRPI